ncbi:MAG TPA: hypothetical protein VKT99_12280 [Xanthobacteraceae bacterium]|nr:hypothetical protein [Xanthobacteraceae bacterium]
MRETDPGGASEAIFKTDKPCIVVKADRQGRQAPLLWALAERKCADGAFFLFEKNEVHLHIVEIKSKITLGEWAKILKQFEGMFLTALAVARLLQVHELARVTCYVAGRTDSITNKSQSASPALLKTPVGMTKTLGGHEYWEKELVELPLSFRAPLVKGWKNSAGVVDFGSV